MAVRSLKDGTASRGAPSCRCIIRSDTFPTQASCRSSHRTGRRSDRHQAGTHGRPGARTSRWHRKGRGPPGRGAGRRHPCGGCTLKAPDAPTLASADAARQEPCAAGAAQPHDDTCDPAHCDHAAPLRHAPMQPLRSRRGPPPTAASLPRALQPCPAGRKVPGDLGGGRALAEAHGEGGRGERRGGADEGRGSQDRLAVHC